MSRVLSHTTISVEASRRVTEETPGGGVTHRRVPDGKIIGEVEVILDEHILRQMAERALRAKSKRAVVGSGLIKCIARNVRRLP